MMSSHAAKFGVVGVSATLKSAVTPFGIWGVNVLQFSVTG